MASPSRVSPPGAEQRWLVPRRIQRGFELYPGWGLIEGAIVATGAVLGAAILVVGWLTGNLLAGIFAFVPASLGVLGLAVIVSMPLPFSDPLWRHIQGAWQFMHSQKTWLFAFGHQEEDREAHQS